MHESPHFCGLSASRGAGICRRYVRGRSPWTHPGPLASVGGKETVFSVGAPGLVVVTSVGEAYGRTRDLLNPMPIRCADGR